jgi:RNA polymerase sigma-70 factor (ECF subfamily)
LIETPNREPFPADGGTDEHWNLMERPVTPLRLIAQPEDQQLPVDTKSLESVFRAYSKYVAGVAARLLGRDDEVDDVVQMVFLTALKGMKQLREPKAAKGWLATVTVRVATRKLRYRRLKSWVGMDEAPDYGESVVAPGATPEERLLLSRVYAVLDELPTKQRVAWTLRHVEGERLEDVARLSGCSLATAKRWIASAQASIEGVVSDE